MEFDYTPEQIQLRREVREFAAAEIAPHVMEWDENQIFPLEVIKKLGKLGYMGAIFPEEYGGAGLGYIEYSIIIRGTLRAWMARSESSSPPTGPLLKPHLQSRHRRAEAELPDKTHVGRMDRLLVSRLSPKPVRAAGTRSTAVRDGDCWVLNGSKTFTTNAHYADVCVGMAMSDRSASRHGISAFILPKDTPGFRAGKKENKLGLRASATGEVIFSNCRVPQSQLLGKPGEGFVDSLRILDGGRVSISAPFDRVRPG